MTVAELDVIFAELTKQYKATVVAKRKGRRCLSPALIVLGVDQERRALAGSPTEKQWN